MMFETMEDFYSYVLDFYGDDGIYEIGATLDMVMEATQKYISSGVEFCGDSFDREHVRDIMLRDYGLQWCSNGPSSTAVH